MKLSCVNDRFLLPSIFISISITKNPLSNNMQTFSFGHPCEHQLRRTCIGGVSCPLNGYPDMWCCSYIKGKINFKRDRPCEGQRCRWNFTHPTQNHFDTVNGVLKDGRLLAARLEDPALEPSALTFSIDAHPADTAYCGIQMLKIPTPIPSTNRKVGHLIVCAVLKANDSKVFGQLMKVCKKPLDYALIGAFEYVSVASPARGTKKRKDDVGDDIRSELVELMFTTLVGSNAAGTLVDREEQRSLQISFIRALRTPTFLKNKKKQEMLEAALVKFPISASKVEVLPPPSSEATALEDAVSGGTPSATATTAAAPLGLGAMGPSAVGQAGGGAIGSGVNPQAGNVLLSLRLDDGDGSDQPKWVGISKVSKEGGGTSSSSSNTNKYTPLLPLDWSCGGLDTMPVLGGLFSLTSKGRSLLGPLLDDEIGNDESDFDDIIGSAAVASA